MGVRQSSDSDREGISGFDAAIGIVFVGAVAFFIGSKAVGTNPEPTTPSTENTYYRADTHTDAKGTLIYDQP